MSEAAVLTDSQAKGGIRIPFSFRFHLTFTLPSVVASLPPGFCPCCFSSSSLTTFHPFALPFDPKAYLQIVGRLHSDRNDRFSFFCSSLSTFHPLHHFCLAI